MLRAAAKSVGAAIVIFVTTADDALWLLPMLTSPKLSIYSRCIHALTFIVGLQFVVGMCTILVRLLGTAILKYTDFDDLDKFAAGIAWMIAFVFWLRSYLKRRRKAASKAASLQGQSYGSVLPDDAINDNSISKCEANSDANRKVCNGLEEEDPRASPSNTMPCTVLGLTILGALDELAYFPTLLLSGTFTYLQLAFGALCACLAILLIIVFFLTRFRPLLEFFDRIPLYVVVAAFALLMTISCFVPWIG